MGNLEILLSGSSMTDSSSNRPLTRYPVSSTDLEQGISVPCNPYVNMAIFFNSSKGGGAPVRDVVPHLGLANAANNFFRRERPRFLEAVSFLSTTDDNDTIITKTSDLLADIGDRLCRAINRKASRQYRVVLEVEIQIYALFRRSRAKYDIETIKVGLRIATNFSRGT